MITKSRRKLVYWFLVIINIPSFFLPYFIDESINGFALFALLVGASGLTFEWITDDENN